MVNPLSSQPRQPDADSAPNSTQDSASGASNSRYDEPFTIDYNPAPDLQSDNESIEVSPLSRQQLNGKGKGSSKGMAKSITTANSNLVNSNLGNSGNGQDRYKRQSVINPIKVAQAPISVIAIAGVIVLAVWSISRKLIRP